MTEPVLAQPITTALEWIDLVLDQAARRELDNIATWVRHEVTLMDDWALRRRLKPGYRCLFHGPPGTGKTLTACLLGKVSGREVCRVDLLKAGLKYFGDAEKNIDELFDRARLQNWILFFDDADVLVGKRTERRDSNDRMADLQIAYLWQRIEDYPGLAIVATNAQSHMDDAFARRFQSAIKFRVPDAEDRLRLWEDNFRDKPFKLASDIDLPRLARDYPLTGGNIANVLRFACLQAVKRDPPAIDKSDLVEAVRREFRNGAKPASNRPSRRKRGGKT